MRQYFDLTIANVVFPTGIDRRDDLSSPDRFDVYYGMADYRIGVARLDVPNLLPPGEVVAHQRALVVNARLRDQVPSATWATAYSLVKRPKHESAKRTWRSQYLALNSRRPSRCVFLK